MGFYVVSVWLLLVGLHVDITTTWELTSILGVLGLPDLGGSTCFLAHIFVTFLITVGCQVTRLQRTKTFHSSYDDIPNTGFSPHSFLRGVCIHHRKYFKTNYHAGQTNIYINTQYIFFLLRQFPLSINACHVPISTTQAVTPSSVDDASFRSKY